MPATNTVPSEVKDLISTLKSNELYKLYDVNKDVVLHHAPSNTSQPLILLRDQFYKHCPQLKWEEYSGYVRSSIPAIGGFTFAPKEEKLKSYGLIDKLNTYKEYKPNSFTSTSPDLFTELLERMFPCYKERHTFTQWLAHTIRKPQQRPTWAVMLTSDEGTGKGVLFHKFISPLLLNQAVQCSNYNQFLGAHSTALSNSLFVMLDDTKSHSDSLITELKSKISEPEILLNPKYLQPYKQNVYARILLASNEKRPIRLSENDTRRWFAPAYITHRTSREESQQFFSKLIDWIDNHNGALDSVHAYLSDYDLSDFNLGYVAPTETLDTMVVISKSVKDSDVEEWVTNNKVFKLEQLTCHFSDYPDLAKSYALNYCNVKKLALDGKSRSNWWVSSDLTPKQAREYYQGLSPSKCLF